MASVANLDIPGELALVYCKIDDWDSYQNSQHVTAASKDVLPMESDYKLPVDINAHAFSKYTNIYFTNPDWGVQMEPIRRPLTSIHGEENVERAITVFKLILRFMCDTNLNEKQEKVLSDYIVQMGLQHENIRDEILCQVVNQTWLNQNLPQTERAWKLLTNCLCCFNPSPTLYKYLLKYSSDMGPNIYKQACQHKLLESASIDRHLSRVYPPTFLEWKTIERKASMGLQVTFPDGVHTIGHVESWTSGEQFTSHLLKLRGLNGNSQGWTVQLQDDDGCYELMGYDYVLDLVGETELAPGFPASTACFLVSVDRSKERKAHRKHSTSADPHNPDKERMVYLTKALPERDSRTAQKEEDFTLSTSVLNQRSTEVLPVGLSEDSPLNLRYTNYTKTPSSSKDSVTERGGASTNIDLEFSDLSANRLNTRYFQNGDDRATETDELSESKLNQRYNKRNKSAHSKAVRESDYYGHGAPSAVSESSDWSHLVDDIFSSALHEHDRQDGRSLGNRIKGGGQGLPGLHAQQPIATQPVGLNYGLSNPVLGASQPVFPAVNFVNAASLPTMGLLTTDPVTAQRLAQQQQQQLQQQQMVQAYMSQPQSSNQTQQILQAQKQQTAALRQALEQQELENKLLKQSIEQEALKQQLQQMKLYQEMQPVIPLAVPVTQTVPAANKFTALNRGPSFRGAGNTGLVHSGRVLSNTNLHTEAVLPNQPDAVTIYETDEQHVTSNQPPVHNKVSLIRSALQKQEDHSKPNFLSPTAPKQSKFLPQTQSSQNLNSSNAATHKVTSKSSTIESHHSPPSHVNASANHALASANHVPASANHVPSSANHRAVIPEEAPPTVSHDPISGEASMIEIDKNSGTFTIRDKSGQSQLVRVGKVVWPPPLETKKEKNDVKVGKLEIDENVAMDIESRILATKKWQKPEPIKHNDGKPMSLPTNGAKSKPQRGNKLTETPHMNTMRMLEQKLRGSSQAITTNIQETSYKNVVSDRETEDIYEKFIDKDELQPPPLPKSTPPKLRSTSMAATETSIVSRRSSDQYSHHIEPEPVFHEQITSRPPEITPPHQKSQSLIDYIAFEHIATELFSKKLKFFLTYSKGPWELHVRKELFRPDERLENPAALHLIYCQIVRDTFNKGCVRISEDQRAQMRELMENHGVNQHNYQATELKPWVKRVIVDTAKEWSLYFSRLFPIAAHNGYSNVRHLAVSHSGLYLVTRGKNYSEDFMSVLEEIRFEDVYDVALLTSSTLEIMLRAKSLIFQTTRAKQLKSLIDNFCGTRNKETEYVVSCRDFIAREPSLLNFKQGDIIKLIDPEMNLKNGWIYGCLNGSVGLIPSECVRQISRQEVETFKNKPVLYKPKLTNDKRAYS